MPSVYYNLDKTINQPRFNQILSHLHVHFYHGLFLTVDECYLLIAEIKAAEPKTKEEVPISARKVVSFYVSNLLKKRING